MAPVWLDCALPFFSMNGRQCIVLYALMGILLSVYRGSDIRPEPLGLYAVKTTISMKNPRKIDEKVLAGRIKHGIIKILRRGRAKEICTRLLPENKEEKSC